MVRHHVTLEILTRGVILITALPLRGVRKTFIVIVPHQVALIRLILKMTVVSTRLIKEIRFTGNRGEIRAVGILVFRIDLDII